MLRPARNCLRNVGTAPASINFCKGAGIVDHFFALNETSCPRATSTAAARLHSSSLPPQGRPPIVEKKAIRIIRPQLMRRCAKSRGFGGAIALLERATARPTHHQEFQ